MCGECGCGEKEKSLSLNQDILKDNKRKAEGLRVLLDKNKVLSANIMGSPGSGKTSLIEKTILMYGDGKRFGVIEGDLETDLDHRRLKSIGVNSIQINTGTVCHLDADMIEEAVKKMPLTEIDFLFIENVGNLVCPSLFDLGTHINVVLLSVTEGEDKPLKYPLIFKRADVILLTKIDLIPFLRFDEEILIRNIKSINSKAPVIRVSAVTEEGIIDWINLLESFRKDTAPLP